MDQHNKVVFCGNFQFPDKNAAGKRVLGLGMIFQSLGYSPVFIGVDDCNDSYVPPACFGDFTSIPVRKSVTIKEWLQVRTIFKEYIHRFEDINVSTISYIVIYGSPVISLWANLIIRWAKRNNVKVLFDCVDWIERSGRGGLFDIVKFLDTNLQKKHFAMKADGVIVISQYLSTYYKSKNMSTILIPPVGIKSDLISPLISDDGIIHVVYAGFMGSTKKQVDPLNLKDRLDVAIDIFLGLLTKGIKAQFEIYGITLEEYIKVLPDYHDLSRIKNIFFYGIHDRDIINNAITNADFTILIRDDNLVSKAGFPTKVSESLLLGTPVIVNNFGDIKDYIIDGANGIIVERDPTQAIQKLSLILSKQTSVEQFKKNLITDSTFTYESYISKFGQFLQSL